MLAVLVVWIVLFSIFFALGDTFFMLLGKAEKRTYRQSIPDTFFIGLMVGGIVSCIISLFVPLSLYIFLGILLLTSAHWVAHRKRLFGLLKTAAKAFGSLPLLGKVLIVILGFVVLYHSASFSASVDQFLYHQQHIKWLQEYGVVKGLANLHLRFGFNSSALSIAGLFVYRPELKISFTALNGLCLFIFTLWLTLRMLKSKGVILSFIYATTLIVFAHFYAMELSSTSTDVMVNVIVAYLLLACLTREKSDELYLALAVLPAFCVTLKLSSAPVILLCIYAWYYLLKTKRTKALFLTIGMTVAMTIPWLVQNIILSGYLIFPFPDINLFSFDWKVPEAIVVAEKINTYNWAKGITDDSSFLAWIPNWWQNHLQPMDKAVYLLALLSVILSVFIVRKAKKNNLLLAGYLTAVLGTIFVFLTAPALRFGLGFTLIIVLMTIFILFQNQEGNKYFKGLYGLQYLFIGAFIIFHFQYIGSKTVEKMGLGYDYVRAQYIKPFPLSLAGGQTVFDTIRMDGIDIFVPQNSQCADHELPCTVGVINNLQLRGESIVDGFRIRQN